MSDKVTIVALMVCLIVISFGGFVLGIIRDNEVLRMFEEIQEGRNGTY